MDDAEQLLRQRRRWIALAAGVIAFLALGHVVPAMIQARKMARRRTCIANLKQIDQATLSWQVDHKTPPTAIPVPMDLFPPNQFPACPDQGVYTLGNALKPPTCNLSSHAIIINPDFLKDPRRYSPQQ